MCVQIGVSAGVALLVVGVVLLWPVVASGGEPQGVEAFSLARYAGDVLVLEIGTIGCEQSEAGIASLEKLSKANLAGLSAAFVHASEDEGALKAFLANQPVSYDVYSDTSGEIAAQFRYQAVPTFYLIGKWGEVRFEGGWNPKEMSTMLKTLLVEDDPSGDLAFFLAQTVGKGDKAPPFALEDPAGAPVRLEEALKGSRLGLVVFGNDWCPFSRTCHKRLADLHRKHGAKGLKMVVVHVGEFGANTKRYYETLNLPCPLALDTGEKVSDQYGIAAVPTVLLVEPNSTVCLRGAYSAGLDKTVASYLETGVAKAPEVKTTSQGAG